MISLIWMRRGKTAWAIHEYKCIADAEAKARLDFAHNHEEFRIDRVEVRDREGRLCFHLQQPAALKGPPVSEVVIPLMQ